MAEDLPADVKIFIVQELACFRGPSEVLRAVKDEFDLTVTRQRVHLYDPTKRAGRDLSADLKTLFETTRAQFVEETTDIAVAHRAVRLRWLNEMIVTAKDKGNVVGAAQLIEQAAKEVGNFFANRRKLEHTGADGKPVKYDRIERIIVDPANQEPSARDILADRLAQIAKRREAEER